jgi:hypothetical protein
VSSAQSFSLYLADLVNHNSVDHRLWRLLDWFCLQEGEYVPLPVEADGVVRSRVFPGLWLAVEAMVAGDMARVLAVLQAGLATAEQTAFVERLASQIDRPD